MLNFGSSGLDGRYFGVGLRGKLWKNTIDK
jgi:hypothetical protein